MDSNGVDATDRNCNHALRRSRRFLTFPWKWVLNINIYICSGDIWRRMGAYECMTDAYEIMNAYGCIWMHASHQVMGAIGTDVHEYMRTYCNVRT